MSRRAVMCVLVGGALLLAAPGHEAAAGTRPGGSKPLFQGTPIAGPPVGTARPLPGSHHPALVIQGDLEAGIVRAAAYPADFTFDDRLAGTGFQPGERVSISVGGAANTEVVADGSGAFVAQVRFSWVFCGASGSMSPAPVMRASGSQGSSAATAERARTCPTLVVADGGVPGRSALSGFGFGANEQVTVRESTVSGGASGYQTHVTADSMGRFHMEIPAITPVVCGRVNSPPTVTAQGSRGTSVSLWPGAGKARPACPVHVGPGAARPLRQPALVAVRVSTTSVRPGDRLRVWLVANQGGTATLEAIYPGGSTARRSARLGASGRASLTWRLPRALKRGSATLTVTLPATGITAHVALQVT